MLSFSTPLNVIIAFGLTTSIMFFSPILGALLLFILFKILTFFLLFDVLYLLYCSKYKEAFWSFLGSLLIFLGILLIFLGFLFLGTIFLGQFEMMYDIISLHDGVFTSPTMLADVNDMTHPEVTHSRTQLSNFFNNVFDSVFHIESRNTDLLVTYRDLSHSANHPTTSIQIMKDVIQAVDRSATLDD